MDSESEQDMADHRRRIYGPGDGAPIISTPQDRRDGNGNGKKWWRETWSKAVGGALGTIVLIVVTGLYAKAMWFGHATVELYGLSPRMTAAETELRAQGARLDAQVQAQRMTPAQVQTLAQEIATAMSKQKGKQ